MVTLDRQRCGALLLAGVLLSVAACGTKPGELEDEDHLLSGQWQFEPVASELFGPQRMLLAQSNFDTRVLLEGALFGTHFERTAVSPAAPVGLSFQVTFTRLEVVQQFEVLTLSIEGVLTDVDKLEGSYEVRGNLSSGGTLRLESGPLTASREKLGP